MQTPNLPPAISAALCNLLHAIMTHQPIAAADNPSTGADGDAQSYADGAKDPVSDDTSPRADAIAAFKQSPVGKAPDGPELPYSLTAKVLAAGHDVEAMIEEGWTLEDLAAEGWITIKAPIKTVEELHAGLPHLLDSNGINWDERIHASTRTQNTDGSWKKRKGVEPGEYVRIAEELRVANLEPFTPLAASKPAAPPPAAKAKVPPPPPAAKASAPPAGEPSRHPESLGNTVKDFAAFCQYMIAKELPQIPKAAQDDVYAQFGVKGIGDMNTEQNRELLDLVYQAMRAIRPAA